MTNKCSLCLLSKIGKCPIPKGANAYAIIGCDRWLLGERDIYFDVYMKEIDKGQRCGVVDHEFTGCKEGYVYILKCGDVYKIGCTHSIKTVKNRKSAWRNKTGLDLLFFHLLKTACAYGLEKYLHKKFSEKKVSGEFFILSDCDIQFIERLDFFAQKSVTHA